MLRENGMERYEAGTIDQTVGGAQEAGQEEGEPYMGATLDQLRKLGKSSSSEDNRERSRTYLGPTWNVISEIKQQREAARYSTGEILYNLNKLVRPADYGELRTMARLSEPKYNMKATDVPMPDMDFAVDKLVMAYGGKAAGYKN